jgi:hypothetical protein
LGLAYESEEDSDPEIEQVPAYTEMKAQRRESQTDLLWKVLQMVEMF